MNKETLENLIEKGLTYKGIAQELNIGNSTVSYYLKKYGLKTKNNQYNRSSLDPNIKKCSHCGNFKPIIDFYKRRGERKDYNAFCKICNVKYQRERLRGIKIKMIEYKGGKCDRCLLKFDQDNYFLFDFHHLDPSIKDPNFGRIKFQNWNRIKDEIDKCVLVCANCHRIIHYLQRRDLEEKDCLS